LTFVRDLLRIALVGLAVGSAGATCNGAHEDAQPVVRESPRTWPTHSSTTERAWIATP
jgi:hypothetical protein